MLFRMQMTHTITSNFYTNINKMKIREGQQWLWRMYCNLGVTRIRPFMIQGLRSCLLPHPAVYACCGLLEKSHGDLLERLCFILLSMT